MRIIIKDAANQSVIDKMSIPYSQNPIEALMNWCDNCGYRYFEIEWEAA